MKPMTILSIFVCLLSVLSCGSDNEEAEVAVIDVSPAQLSATHEGLVTSLTVNSGLEWTAFSDDACKDWISCKTTDNGSRGTVEVTVKANTTYQSREGKVVVKAGAARTSIPVTQAARPEPSVDPDITVPEGYRLVWNEEFNKGTQPDLDQWYYETGGNGWGNNELQHYVAGNQGNEQLAAVKDGILSIIAKKIGETVYSIRMNTKESWKYGYFEARLKLPTGKGTWPAFWMMPKNYTAWPDDGEIDIMEEVGYNANYVSSAIHCKAYHHSIGTQKTGETFLPTAQTEFHVYALEWTEDFIRTFVDGKQLFRFDNDKANNRNTWPFNAPFYLKLNLAWGGDWGGAQGVDESALPATYEIDYVRVFQKK